MPRLAQTPGIKVLEGTENRIVFIGMDQARDELLYSNVKGKNPFKDKRVRQALYHAVDIEAIKKNTMRGLSQPSGAHAAVAAQTTPEIEKRLPYDRERAKKLLAEAGYPNGFEVTLDCPNNRYVNDEKICQALAAMWSQVGVKTKVNTMPRAVYFPKLEKTDTSMYMLGWGGGTTDAIFMLQPVLSTHNGKGDGDYNYGRYTNPKLDELTAKIKVNMNADRAPRPDPRGAARAQRGDQPHSAAPAGDPVGDAQQRHRRAPRRQQRHPVLGHDQIGVSANRRPRATERAATHAARNRPRFTRAARRNRARVRSGAAADRGSGAPHSPRRR